MRPPDDSLMKENSNLSLCILHTTAYCKLGWDEIGVFGEYESGEVCGRSRKRDSSSPIRGHSKNCTFNDSQEAPLKIFLNSNENDPTNIKSEDN